MSDSEKESLFSQIQESIELKHEETDANMLKTDDVIEKSEEVKKFIMVETLVYPKELITQAFYSVSFPPDHCVTEKQLFEIGASVLQAFGILVHDYPYAFSEFFVKKWVKNFGEKTNLQELIEEMLTIIEAARLSKIIIRDYFNFIKNTLQNYLTGLISSAQTIELLMRYSNSAIEACIYLAQSNKEYVLETHFRIVFEDNFAIVLAFICLNDCSKALAKISDFESSTIEDVIMYIDEHIDIDELFRVNNASHIKILIRNWLFKDLSCINDMPRSSMIGLIKKYPPVLFDSDDFYFFSSIINSTTMKQSINLFIEDTLNKDNQLIETKVDGKQKFYKAPFKAHDEGLKMIYDAFRWTISSGKTFYAYLLNYAHGFSDDGYIFINQNYITNDDFALSFRALTLIHETFHLYKRIGKNENIKISSPVNSFVIQLEEKEKSKDGARFENILIPNKGLRLYFSAAKFLNKLNNWAKPLEEFQKGFSHAQEVGMRNGGPSMPFSLQQSMDWPRCLRIPFFNS